MIKSKFKFFSYLLISVFLALGLSISIQSLLAAWSPPAASPPSCTTGDAGCDAPLNISATAQQKAGMLLLNTGGSANGLIVQSGKVGIGEISPIETLHVAGSAYFAGSVIDDSASGKNLIPDWQMESDTYWTDNPEQTALADFNGVTHYAHDSAETGTSCYNWAHTALIPADPNKLYKFSIWIKSTDATMNNYFGFHIYDASKGRITGDWNNPYFKTSQSDANTWKKWTAYLGSSYAGGATGCDSSKTNGNDWCMESTTAFIKMRFGACYGDGGSNGHSYFMYPKIEEIDPDDGWITGNLVIMDGKVGIGTTNPGYELDVSGNARVGSAGVGYLYLGNRGYYIGDDSVGDDIQTNAPNMYVYDSGWKRLVREGDSVLNGDNLGNHSASQNIKLSGYWLSNDGGDEGVFVKTDGKVGIGTAQPDSSLHVVSSGSDGTPNVDGVQIVGKDSSNNAAIELTTNGGTPYIDFQNDTAGTDFDMRVILTGDNNLRIDGGNLQMAGGGKIFFNNGSTYGVGASGSNYNSISVDTLDSGSCTDTLELNYYCGADVKIGPGSGTHHLLLPNGHLKLWGGIYDTYGGGDSYYLDLDVGGNIKSLGIENNLTVGGTATANYVTVNPQDDTNEGGEIGLVGAGSYGDIHIDNYQGNARIHTLATGKNFQVLGGGIYTEGDLTVGGSIYSSGNHDINNTSPTVYLRDTNHRSAMVHVNSNLFYVLRGCGNNSASWCLTGGYWPLYINLENNDAVFGRHLSVPVGNLNVGGWIYPGRNGIVGSYDSYQIQNIYSMGSSYVPNISGNGDFGSQYGMSYCHTNNSNCKSGYGHQIDIVQNGTVGIALGMGGNAWFGGSITAASFNCTSDERLKKDISEIDNALLKLNEIDGVYFNWKDEINGKGQQVGVIAQDVEKVLPEVVSANDDGYKTVEYSKISPLLIEAVKELDKKNEDYKKKASAESEILKDQIEALQLRIEQLEKLNKK